VANRVEFRSTPSGSLGTVIVCWHVAGRFAALACTSAAHERALGEGEGVSSGCAWFVTVGGPKDLLDPS
jgi:hypothetical protein